MGVTAANGGCIPTAASWAIDWAALWPRPGAPGGTICGLKKGCIGVCIAVWPPNGRGGWKLCCKEVGRAGEYIGCIPGCCNTREAGMPGGMFRRGRFPPRWRWVEAAIFGQKTEKKNQV